MKRSHKVKIGCVGMFALFVGLPITSYTLWARHAERVEQAALAAQQAATDEAVDPVLAKFAEAEPDYDIDRTIQAIHEIDRALESSSMDDWLYDLARRDYRGVAPDVLNARANLLRIQMDLQSKQLEADDQEALWELTTKLMLGTASVVAFSGEVNTLAPSGSVSINREQAASLLADLQDKQQADRQLRQEIEDHKRELFDALLDYSAVYWQYTNEWDQLSLLRDRAYLAAHNGDWDAARSSAELAIARAPHDTEAHLLDAMAMIEGGDQEDDEAIGRLLSDYIAQHPDRTAPALLLMGVNDARRGRTKAAQLAFQQSAAYYPRQADALTDMLDPYKSRSFLHKSREGGFIVELYQSTMLGAGYFSPDLQMAKLAFDQGDKDTGRAKVLDHFARRRAQEQWDFILSDIRFCQTLLGPDFWDIFPEDTYLDLEVSPTLWGSGLNLAVNNRSARTLHNATLVLALHFTDMYPDQYKTLTAPKTVPAVMAHDSTSFGTADINEAFLGANKTVDDIVQHRAILVTDEAVTWVDTDAFKTAEAEEFRNRKRMAKARDQAVEHPLARQHPQFEDSVEKMVRDASANTRFEVESAYGKDAVLVKLPRELAILRPIFRLRRGDQIFTADDNVIDGDQIALRFTGVENYDEVARDPLELLMGSPFGDVVLTWNPGGDIMWRLDNGPSLPAAPPTHPLAAP